MASNEYTEVLASLYRLEAAKGMDFKLERVALALKNLGNPHRRVPAVHVAGTNGKGSVAAMLHAIFSAAGYRVGLYTSPHLVSFTERIRIADARIQEEEVVELAHEIHAAATVHGIDLTFFEFVTVMAFLQFARRGAELAVIEVGLGGRLDATNVVDPEVAVITTIGLDHQEFLGDTLQSIAAEKAGIIKAGRPVVIGPIPPVADGIFHATAAQRHAPLYRAGSDFALTAESHFRFDEMAFDVDGLRVGLRGRHQCDNAATALAAAAVLRSTFPFGSDALRHGLATVRWPGRLEVVQDAPLVILDGAHNLDGMLTLAAELPGVTGNRPLHLLFGVMRDKRWEPMIDAIAPLIASATVTSILPPRGESPEALAQAFRPHCPVRTVSNAPAALEQLLACVGPDEAVLVTGSLFLIGAIYPCFLSRLGHRDLFTSDIATLQP